MNTDGKRLTLKGRSRGNGGTARPQKSTTQRRNRGAACQTRGHCRASRLREHLGQVRGEPDYRVLDCAEVKDLLAPVWKQESYCPQRGRDNPASFHAVT